VTGSRVSRAASQRGDWNACTVNDPKRQLDKCQSSAAGKANSAADVAAGHIAEGLALSWDGELDQAIAAFGAAIAAKPRSSSAYLNRGLAYQRQGDLDRAAADLDRAVKYAPYSARAVYNRGLLRAQRGDKRGARADAARAVALDPSYDEVEQ
jgi:tetratricopeptide (TPR) repeat protein